MNSYCFMDNKGTFCLENPEDTSYLYFPIAGEGSSQQAGLKSSITPELAGDCKLDQNTFVLQPVSSEELHNNRGTRNFWCRQEGKPAWSATGNSAWQQAGKFTEQKEYSMLEAGIMWHRIYRTSKEQGISAKILSFVPYAEDKVEIMKVDIRNTSEDTVTFTATAAIPIYARSADNIRDHRHVTSLLHRIRTTKNAVLVTPTLTFDERGHQKNMLTYYVAGTNGKGGAPDGFFPETEEFIGEGGTCEWPAAVVENRVPEPAGREYAGYEAMGGLRFQKVTLAPEEEISFIILIGVEGSAEEAEKTASKYRTAIQVEAALNQTKEYWYKKLNVSFETKDCSFDNYMYWVSFQPMLRRIYGCSFLPHHDYGKGGRGWRDLWQDCLALLMMNPDGVSGMLYDNYAGVRMDGTNATIIGSRQGEFIADRNNITRVWMDHGVWPLMTTAFYIEQSGDADILLREQVYFKDRQACRGEQKDSVWDEEGDTNFQKTEAGEDYKGSLLEHILIQNLTAFFDVGEHNHIRLRGADWNDAMDMAAERGESVAFTAAYADNLSTLAELLRRMGEKQGKDPAFELAEELEPLIGGLSTEEDEKLYGDGCAKQKLLYDYCGRCLHTVTGRKIKVSASRLEKALREKADWIRNHIRDTEWKENGAGGWFNGYYDNHGRQVEGMTEAGPRMMLTSQVFTIMSGTAQEEQVKQMVQAADQYLFDASIGGYRLNTDFGEVKADLGRMFGFAYGHKENGAVFSHMTVMYANSLYKRGFVKEGYRALNALYQQAANFQVSRIYPGIPEYFNNKGRGMYHYLTGSASWLLMTVITEMFGIKGRDGDLLLEPKLLAEQFDESGEIGMELQFAGQTLHIRYLNTGRKSYVEYKAASYTLDSEELLPEDGAVLIARSRLQQLDPEKTHQIVVRLR